MIDMLKQLTLHEDKRNMIYKCSAGFNSIGIGHNLDANPISDKAIAVIFEDDMEIIVYRPLDANLPWWRNLDEARQRVLMDMCFNLGWTRLSQFQQTFQAVKEGRYEDAASGLEKTKWYGQVGSRAKRLVQMMRTGIVPPEVL